MSKDVSKLGNFNEWTTVTHKAKVKVKKIGGKTLKNEKKQLNHQDIIANMKSSHINTSINHIYGIDEISRYKVLLRECTLFTALKAKIKKFNNGLQVKFDTVIGLGIGSFSTSASSLLQFCLLQLIAELFLVDGDNIKSSNSVQIFDPTMNSDDSSICSELGVIVNKDNKMGKYDAVGRTLFFMPHCPYRLYCNLLWQNWSQLSNTVILGNSFQSYSDRRMSSPTSDASDTLHLLSPCVEETGVWHRSNTFVRDVRNVSELSFLENAFCDLSLMRFPGPDEHSNDKWGRLEKILMTEKISESVIDAASALDLELF